jgi:hypothetical protein
MKTREFTFSRDWTPEHLEEFFTPYTVCGACNGTKVLGLTDCFCCAYSPSECGCGADWGDYVYWEDLE